MPMTRAEIQRKHYRSSCGRANALWQSAPRKGYTPDNCRVVLWGLNCALGQWGEDVFATIAKAYAQSEWLR